jgi:hypothetical protein
MPRFYCTAIAETLLDLSRLVSLTRMYYREYYRTLLHVHHY